MRKKVLGLSLAILFFGSITSSTFAMTTTDTESVNIVVVDDDKDKTKAKKSKSKKDCEARTECCSSAKKAKSCDEKKGEDKK